MLCSVTYLSIKGYCLQEGIPVRSCSPSYGNHAFVVWRGLKELCINRFQHKQLPVTKCTLGSLCSRTTGVSVRTCIAALCPAYTLQL